MTYVDDISQFAELYSLCNVPKQYILPFSSMTLPGGVDRNIDIYKRVMFGYIPKCGAKIHAGEFLSHPLHFVISGPFGIGKTRIAVWLLAQAFAHSLTMAKSKRKHLDRPFFFKVGEYLTHRFDDERFDKMTERAQKSMFLVLDDLQRTPDRKGDELLIEQIIDHRLNNNLSTIITTSTDKKSMEQTRIASLLDCYFWFAFNVESFRRSPGKW